MSFLIGPVASLSRAADLGLLLLRVVTGAALALAHGIGKVPPSQRFVERVGSMGFPAPEVFAWLAAAAEVGAPLLLAVGLLTRPVGAILAGYMLLIVFIAHAGDPFGAREKAVLFASISATLALTGAGRFSLDALVRERLSRPEGT